MPADVVGGVQRAVLVGGDQHRLPARRRRRRAGRARAGRGRRAGRRRTTRRRAPGSRSRAQCPGSTYISRGRAGWRSPLLTGLTGLTGGITGPGSRRRGGRRTGDALGGQQRQRDRAARLGDAGRDRRAVVVGERRAARVEAAAGRDPGRVGDLAAQHDRLEPLHLRHHREQRPRVGVAGRAEHLLGRAGLDDPAEVHHRDPVGDVPGQAQVVGDTRTPRPSSSRSRSSSARISPRIEASRLDTGSSAMSSRGRSASAPAMRTRWRCPPDSSWG